MNQQNEIEKLKSKINRILYEYVLLWFPDKRPESYIVKSDLSTKKEALENLIEQAYNQGRIDGIKSVELKSKIRLTNFDYGADFYNQAVSDLEAQKRKLIEKEVK